MLKKTITFEDYDGKMVSEDYYFHLSKAELVQLELEETGGFGEMLQRIAAEENHKEIVKQFQRIIKISYGKKAEDGRRFSKSPEILAEFVESPAYSELFVELSTDSTAAVNFVRGVMPSGLANQVDTILASQKTEEPEVVALPETNVASEIAKPSAPEPTKRFEEMSREELLHWAATSQDQTR